MDTKVFWKLIDTSRKSSSGDISKQADLLVDMLIQLPINEILEFSNILEDLMNNAYDAALWDAAYIIGCGCSDDGFYEFRGWLITQGEKVYKNALVNPESLIDFIEINETAQKGHLLQVVIISYEKKTGQKLPPKYKEPVTLKGVLWDENNKKERFPKLTDKFGDCDKRDSIWFTQ